MFRIYNNTSSLAPILKTSIFAFEHLFSFYARLYDFASIKMFGAIFGNFQEKPIESRTLIHIQDFRNKRGEFASMGTQHLPTAYLEIE